MYVSAALSSGPSWSLEASAPKKLVTAAGSCPPDSSDFAALGLLSTVVEHAVNITENNVANTIARLIPLILSSIVWSTNISLRESARLPTFSKLDFGPIRDCREA